MADKAKTLLERVKALFNDTLPVAYTLADGTQVSISLLDIGGDVSIAGVPATEGSYTLSDGTVLAVDATGKITAVAAPDAMASTEYTLQDGTKITADKMEVGGMVMQGESPIANGDYTLADGSKITTVGGAITVVTPKPAAEAPAAGKMTKEQVQQAYDDITTADPAAPAGDQMAKIVACVKAVMDYCFGWQIDQAASPQEAVTDAQQMADAIAAYVTLKQQFTERKTEIETLRTELTATTATLKQALQLMTELAELPAADPPEGVQRKVVFTGDVQRTKKAGLNKFIAAAGKIAEQNAN